MDNQLLDTYSPPIGLRKVIVDYHLIVTSTHAILPKVKNFYDLDEFSSVSEERGVELEYIFDDGTHINKLIGTISIDGFHSLNEEHPWELFVPPYMRSEMGKSYRVNIYNGKMTVNAYIEYRKKKKLEKFLE